MLRKWKRFGELKGMVKDDASKANWGHGEKGLNAY